MEARNQFHDIICGCFFNHTKFQFKTLIPKEIIVEWKINSIHEIVFIYGARAERVGIRINVTKVFIIADAFDRMLSLEYFHQLSRSFASVHAVSVCIGIADLTSGVIRYGGSCSWPVVSQHLIDRTYYEYVHIWKWGRALSLWVIHKRKVDWIRI